MSILVLQCTDHTGHSIGIRQKSQAIQPERAIYRYGGRVAGGYESLPTVSEDYGHEEALGG